MTKVLIHMVLWWEQHWNSGSQRIGLVQHIRMDGFSGIATSFVVNAAATTSAKEIQQALGADIAMVFDECLPFGADKDRAVASVDRTARWEARSKAAHRRPQPYPKPPNLTLTMTLTLTLTLT